MKKIYPFLRIFVALLLISSVPASRLMAYTVTELQATYKSGQTFLTWKNAAATNLQYNVYRSTSPLSTGASLNSSTFLGYVRDNSAKNIRKTNLLGQSSYFIINPANGPLATDRGLYVATCTNNASYYYAVTVVNLTTSQEDKSTINAGNSMSTPIAETVAYPQPVLQYQWVEDNGTLGYQYVQWGNNQNTAKYPAFNNAGSYGYNFALFKAGNYTNGSIYVSYQDDDPFTIAGVKNFTNCYALKIDDWLPNGVSTLYTGWNENYDMYATTHPVPTTGVVRMYTQTRIKEEIEWIRRSFPVDSNKVYLTGSSHNGYGALLTAQMYPDMVAAICAKVEPILRKGANNSDLEMQMCDNLMNLPSDYNDPNTGLPIPIWTLMDLRHMMMVNSKRGMPYMGDIHGKKDGTIGWVENQFWYDTVNASRQGGTWYWDQRKHDNTGSLFLESEFSPDYERFTLVRSFPAFSYCSINQNPGTGSSTTGDPWGAFNGYLDWSDPSITDNPLDYSITCFVKNMYAGGALVASQYDSCTTNITFRRLQHFQPTIGQPVYWTVKKSNGVIVQQGSVIYTGDAITLTGIKIYRSNSIIKLTTQDCSILYYPDADNDGYGSSAVAGTAYCTPPQGFITNHTDCNDGNASIHPGGQEVCDVNDADEDCDGLTDDADPSVIGKIIYYTDADHDGFGISSGTGTAYCNPPAGVVANNVDCNDGNAGISPIAIDICDGIDNNCNGVVDENAITVSISPDGAISGCYNDPLTFTASGTNITNYQWYKGNDPVAGQTNSTYALAYDNITVKVVVSNASGCTNTSNVTTVTSMYKPTSVITPLNGGNLNLCLGPVDFTTTAGPSFSWQWLKNGVAITGATNIDYSVTSPGDYSVTITNINSGCYKTSVPVTVLGIFLCYIDADQDGYGSSSDPGVTFCDVPVGLVTNNSDCNDADNTVNPAATELCGANNIDEDCDGLIDNDDPSAVGKIIYYTDADNDGYGSSADPGTAYCHPPSGVVLNNSDCNDANASIHPNATELCDANDIDEDCNGLADDADPSAMGKVIYYTDADNDGYGAPSDPGTAYCNPPSGKVVNHTDCNDANAGVHPNGTELCDANDVDEDCDGLADDADQSATGKIIYYVDSDNDSYGSSSIAGTAYCNPPAGLVTSHTDCSDGNAGINPAATEICDGIDNNCNGQIDEGLNPSNPMPAPVITPTGATSFCFDQTVTLSAQPGFSQYTWTNGKTGQSITANTNGAITVTVKDGNNCYGTSPAVNLTVWDLPAPIVTSSGPTTYCIENPSTLSTVAGYAYQWKKGATILTGATNQTYVATSTSTSYKVTLNDVHGCSKTSDNFSVTVNSASAPTLTVSGGSNSICQGQSCTISATSGFSSYLWSSGQTSSSISVSTAGNYFVTATDANGCTATSLTKNITVSPLPQPAITANGPTSFCDGGTVNLDAGSGYSSYNWSNGKATQTVSIISSGSYSVTVTNANGCNGTASAVNVTEWSPPVPIVTTSTGATTFCSNSGVYLTTLAGYSYQWQKGGVNIAGATAQNYTPTSGGSYKVFITDSHGCMNNSATLTIVVNTAPAPVISGSGSVCQGSSVTLSCGTFSAYTWSTGSHASTINVNSAGSYTVTVTDANGCSGTSPVKNTTVVSLPQPVITANGPISFCDGGTVTLDAGSGYNSYNWSNSKTTQTNVITATGTFTVTVTNANGCAGTSAPVTVNEWIPPTPTVSTSSGTTTFCSNAGVYLTTIAGYSYQWQKSSVNIAGATAQNYTPTSGGSYKVIITDSHGCTKTSTAVSITVNTSPAPTISGSGTVCVGSNVALSCGTFSTYTWSTGSHASTINVNSAGSFTVTVTDINGCSGTSPVKTTTVVPLPTPVITAQTSMQFCDGGTVNLDAGSGYSSYNWSNSKSAQTNTITASGTFTVTVTNANGCAGTSPPVTVTEWIPPVPVISTSTGATTFCSNSGVYLTTLAGYSYQWQKSSVNVSGATGQNYTPTSGGSYKVIITDSHGCSKTSLSLSVTVNTTPTASISITGSTNICSGQTKTITANTGSGLTYKWKRDGNIISGATSSTYVASIAGDYTCVVTNTNGCSTASNTITITANCKDDELNAALNNGNASWLIYPNPTSGELHIRLNTGDVENGNYVAEIKNMLGSTIWAVESTFTDHTISADVMIDGAASSGVYFVIVHMNDHVYYSQFVVAKK